MFFVLDCSMAMPWCLEDEANHQSDAVLISLEYRRAIVPSHWALEVANVLAVCERRKRVTDARITEFLGFLGGLPVDVDDFTHAQAFGEILSLARRHQLSVYDAAYLELALRRAAPLASLDNKLNDIAGELGIALFNG